MEIKYTEEELNSIDKALLIKMFLNLQNQMETLTVETKALNDKMQKMMEQLVLANNNRFGRKTEKMSDTNQICFMEVDGKIVFFNEAEAVSDLDAKEPEELEISARRGKKTAGKRAMDMEGLPVERIDHYMTEEELKAEFGEKGWKQLPDTVVKKYHFTPAKITVDEHHIGVYADKEDGHMKRAPHPKGLLPSSPVTPSLAAAVMNGKYVNAVPLYRLEKEFERYGLAITRQNMANWMIRLADEYLGVMYDYLHTKLYGFHVIQADETPVLVNKDGRPAGSKSYMWVYRSGYMYSDRQIVLYEYQRTRNASHPRQFLKDYSGVCVTDGYQVYHTVEKELEDLKPEDRLKQRQVVIKPLVDALFAYLKSNERKASTAKLKQAVTYALNQEKYLRVFLEDGEVPMDNNASERAIRGFCIGKKNWEMIDTINGATSSAIIYSIAETAKANTLKPYEYFEYLLTQIPAHMDDTDRSFLEDLLPWSPKLPAYIRKQKDRG